MKRSYTGCRDRKRDQRGSAVAQRHLPWECPDAARYIRLVRVESKSHYKWVYRGVASYSTRSKPLVSKRSPSIVRTISFDNGHRRRANSVAGRSRSGNNASSGHWETNLLKEEALDGFTSDDDMPENRNHSTDSHSGSGWQAAASPCPSLLKESTSSDAGNDSESEHESLIRVLGAQDVDVSIENQYLVTLCEKQAKHVRENEELIETMIDWVHGKGGNFVVPKGKFFKVASFLQVKNFLVNTIHRASNKGLSKPVNKLMNKSSSKSPIKSAHGLRKVEKPKLPKLHPKVVDDFAANSLPKGSDTAGILRPAKNDVIFGRGNGIAMHPGNAQFRKICWEARNDYHSAQREEKRSIALAVIERVESMGGRFLHRSANGEFSLASQTRVLEKACQALREKKWARGKRPSDESAVGTPMSSRRGNVEESSTAASLDDDTPPRIPGLRVSGHRAKSDVGKDEEPEHEGLEDCETEGSQEKANDIIRRRQEQVGCDASHGEEDEGMAKLDKVEMEQELDTVNVSQNATNAFVCKGMTIAVFWPLDNKHYTASVLCVAGEKVQLRYRDDDEEEWIVLKDHSYKIIDRGQAIPSKPSS